ncbi:MAG: TA system VapC family ribonuclease toxin [Egibacteraceae bacterium]
MPSLDVNILVYAHRSERPEHQPIADWLTGVANAEQAFGVADLVLSGFLRVVTDPRIFEVPTPLPTALAFVRELRARPNRVEVRPGLRHWGLFTSLCEPEPRATSSRTPTSPRWPSSPAASGSGPSLWPGFVTHA